jgi:phospholipase C
MSSRREFLKRAVFVAAASGAGGGFPGSIQKAFAEPIERALSIDPAPGSSFRDAEHVVILMQENRSFDHTYGALRGVRGYNDPRIIRLPSGNPVWLQSNEAGETYAPFRFDIRKTNVTWMGSLPHGWIDQGGARNHGRHDRWLEYKASTTPEYSHMPLTMGHYTREDIPFYYSLADAFTVCDQNFCSSLTPTEPNRLYLWTGTVRAKKSIDSFAHVRNADMGYDKQLAWETFPERLERNGISWKIYQNEISLDTGLTDDENNWLSNFDDNTLEYFVQYNVRYSQSRRRYLRQQERDLAAKLEEMGAQESASSLSPQEAAKQRAPLQLRLNEIRRELATWTPEAFSRLSPAQQNLYRKAFAINDGDPFYRELAQLAYQDGDVKRSMSVPKGDVFHQFRNDVASGNLPAVSWIVAPENFSDHPSSAWYGAWYVSEALHILTQDPEVWKKTIFILCYDENDGYFDHVPPFVPPDPFRRDSGKVSSGIDTSHEYVSEAEEAGIRLREPGWEGKPGPIGLGFRVPLVIASPWSRGGYVCSQVFDHTSMLQFLETFLSEKTGRRVRETNITEWRRTVCGDLTSAFRTFHPAQDPLPEFVKRDPFLISINEAQYKPMPHDFHRLDAEEIAAIRRDPRTSPLLPRQEPGVRPACALPYELEADGGLTPQKDAFAIGFAARNRMFGARAAGAPFRVYALGSLQSRDGALPEFASFQARDYAVSSGDAISDEWLLKEFHDRCYHLTVHGPNGFYREFRGDADDPALRVSLRPEIANRQATGNAELQLANLDPGRPLTVLVRDRSAGEGVRTVRLGPAGRSRARSAIVIDLNRHYNWYDFQIQVEGAHRYEQRYAGHVETGRDSYSDPAMA